MYFTVDSHISQQLPNFDCHPPQVQQCKYSQILTIRSMREREDSFDYRMRAVFIGVPHVGKTSLFQRAFYHTFGSSFRQSMMIWNNFYCRVDGSRVKIYVQDTGGCERYNGMLPGYFRGADSVLFVFDVCDRESLLKIDQYLDLVNQFGNKVDSPNRQVSEEEGRAFAEARNMLYIQTSAKEDINVYNLFVTIAQNVLLQWSKDPKLLIGSQPIQIPNYRRTCC